MSTLDWVGIVRTGVLQLGLSPEAVWNLTPMELRGLLGPQSAAMMDRAGLDALMAAYPDSGRNTDDG